MMHIVRRKFLHLRIFKKEVIFHRHVLFGISMDYIFIDKKVGVLASLTALTLLTYRTLRN